MFGRNICVRVYKFILFINTYYIYRLISHTNKSIFIEILVNFNGMVILHEIYIISFKFKNNKICLKKNSAQK